MAKVVLTADRTLMSNYRENEFLGFSTCAPPNFVPDWLFNYLFFPSIKTRKGQVEAAPYGLRKAEAQLLADGFEVVVADPDHLGPFLKEAKVLGIHVMDPFGLGPASTTLAALFKKEPFLARHFRALLCRPDVQEAKKRGLKIVVGGPGAWQFQFRSGFADQFGIDCVVEGEGEYVLRQVFSDLIEGREMPRHWNVAVKDSPKIEDIPDIVSPSINGLVEIGRGCCRGCEFCSVTLRPLRWHSIEKIMREIEVNIGKNQNSMVCLHGEDVMLYGSTNVIPDDEKLIRLHESVVRKASSISWSHSSLAAVAS